MILVPALIAILCCGSIGVAVGGLKLTSNRRMQSLIRLDRCVGKAALDQRSSQQTIERLQSALDKTRAARKAFLLSGQWGAAEAALQSLRLLERLQKLEVVRFKTRALLYPCRMFERGSLPIAQRPADAIGPAGYSIDITALPRWSARQGKLRSHAEVYHDGTRWRAKWTFDRFNGRIRDGGV